ncbi:hypothetical protein DMB66_34075 [Actinoplanes sp. ATCC 53533]|uniref:hypothetical protein n=1 Tax=Actinoplanes sp. ATCC 53533 TaxID=1288362 RepID=UPI000F772D3C|nr:hypothetical protein [Actinoplanes sp. ATCC 53533]RSM56543.1 hypothetical protein DMB66_34075 [Actinoplanes sp. ATCC 53533]
MGILSKISDWRMKFFLWVGLPIIAAMGAMFGAFDLVPAWQAHGGGGTIGTFTAEREECRRRSCDFHGSWAATDGSERRNDVILYDEPDALTTGQTVEAADTGARNGVFATAGGSTYLLVSAFVVGGLAAFAGWLFVIRNAIRGRRSAAAVPA